MREAVVCILRNSNNDILLLDRCSTPLGYSLPGGKIDEGESIINAVVREVFEETGIKLIQRHVKYVKKDISENLRIVYVFQYDVPIYSNIELSDKEHSGYMWADEKNLNGVNLAGRTVSFIKK